MKKIIKILFAVCAPVWLCFSCAHAEEVTLIPDDSIDFAQHSSATGYDSIVHLEVETNALNYPFTLSNWYLGPQALVTAPSGSVFLSNAGGQIVIAGCPVDRCAYSYYGYQFSDFSIYTDSLIVSLDMSGNLNGYYRYELDFEYGVGFVVDPFQYTSGNNDLTPNYTFSSVPLHIADSDNGMHIDCFLVGEQEYTVSQRADGAGATLTTSLIHFHCESTFYYDSTYGTDIIFNLTPIFNTMISKLDYDMSSVRNTGRSQTAYALYNNRFWSSLYSNVEPPVTPTPTPTPSPNQDIIINNNQNTTNIITSINNGFDALAAAFEGTIYGLTDLIFGGLSDWLDFFSDVQDDFEDNLPVVEFFSIVRNIFANFFPEISSTDPSALQFVAGWESDIYVLHVPALSLVLPEGTFPFFPEVNFDLNNDFMNLIRPYWLTFCNLLVTLLWFRYLLHYLFRWSQLLTGNTAAAFELFMHQPEELDQLAGIGEDPYDLAGDYAYDEIDSEFHDTYQAAEHHYGHGAARYLSGVLHGRIKP